MRVDDKNLNQLIEMKTELLVEEVNDGVDRNHLEAALARLDARAATRQAQINEINATIIARGGVV